MRIYIDKLKLAAIREDKYFDQSKEVRCNSVSQTIN